MTIEEILTGESGNMEFKVSRPGNDAGDVLCIRGPFL